MKPIFPGMVLGVALIMIAAVPPGAHAMGVAGRAGGGGAHLSAGPGLHGFGFRPGFHPSFLPARHLFQRPPPNFGAGFVSHQSRVAAGAYGGDDYASDENNGPDGGEDIENLHFRVQEPFGPWDIGRPPVRPQEDAPYVSDRMDPGYGYARD